MLDWRLTPRSASPSSSSTPGTSVARTKTDQREAPRSAPAVPVARHKASQATAVEIEGGIASLTRYAKSFTRVALDRARQRDRRLCRSHSPDRLEGRPEGDRKCRLLPLSRLVDRPLGP